MALLHETDMEVKVSHSQFVDVIGLPLQLTLVPVPSLQGFAVSKLLQIVDDFWAEIADEVPLMYATLLCHSGDGPSSGCLWLALGEPLAFDIFHLAAARSCTKTSPLPNGRKPHCWPPRSDDLRLRALRAELLTAESLPPRVMLLCGSSYAVTRPLVQPDSRFSSCLKLKLQSSWHSAHLRCRSTFTLGRWTMP